MSALLAKLDQLTVYIDTSSSKSSSSDEQKSAPSSSRIDAINSRRIDLPSHPLSAINTAAPFPKLQNRNLLAAAFGEKPSRLPVWLHRQAGRYMKEFRDLRLRYTFFEICKTPQLVAEVTLQPINAFDLDAAIIFSDILVIPPILGLNVSMVKGVGPVFQNTLKLDDSAKTKSNLQTLTAAQIRSKLNYVYEGITLTRHALKGKVPLIGFVGGPFTLLAYSVEGKSSKTWSAAKRLMYEQPDACKAVLKVLTDATIAHLLGQIDAGCQALEIFESCAGSLSPQLFREFVAPCLRRMREEVTAYVKESGKERVAMILFAREVNVGLDELAKLCGDYEVFAIGWGKEAKVARREMGDAATLQGNLDPWCLYGDDEGITRNVRAMLDAFDVVGYDKKRLIVNLGHGMMPGMRPSAVTRLIQSVRDYEKEKF